jgi:DNA repair protein RecO (recombination protein O)
LLHDFLGLLETGNSSETMMSFFELRLLKLTGFEPVLDRCTACRTPVDDCNMSLMFNPADGGVKCHRCGFNNRDSFPVSLGTIKTLLMVKEMEIDKIDRLSLSEQTAAESRGILNLFIRHILGKEPISLNVLNQIREMGI